MLDTRNSTTLPDIDAARGPFADVFLVGQSRDSIYPRIMRLKQRLRRGWLRVGVPEQLCETVADHIMGVSMLCLLHGPGCVNNYKTAVLLALVHELGEIEVGDIIPADGIPIETKHHAEARAIDDLLKEASQESRVAILELLRSDTEDGNEVRRFVKCMDYLEMGYQALYYQRIGYSGALELLESAKKGLEGTPWQVLLAN